MIVPTKDLLSKSTRSLMSAYDLSLRLLFITMLLERFSLVFRAEFAVIATL